MINGMSVGKDYSIGLYDLNTQAIIDLGDVQRFRSTAQKHNISSMPYNGVPKFGYVPNGYSGSFAIVRTSSVLEDFFISLAQQFNNGGDYLAGYINETIKNGSAVSRYQYIGAVFFLTEVADVSREKTIPLTVEWMASDKKPIA